MNRRSLGFFGLLWVSLALVVLAFPCNATDVEEEGSVPEFYSLPQFLEADPSLELPGGEKSMEDILHGEGTVTEFLLSRQVRLWRKAPDGPDDLYQEFEKTNWSNELSQSSRWVNLTDEECQQSMSLVTEFNYYGPDPLCGPFKPSLAM
ncbi:hypothetical protein SAMN02745166_01404 [Prosthecobacter debontii]|uniref:YARHG domain-containing protein n=1 Tax=Prosthecobacter debontii TaxID=48467 RepID=A0A1T4XGW6_9BACT|nr:hypothetical protein [Prosthecobacter debontii]SKA88345.1 hypothetical protein SAMN02745166_01404 [Prosthecobacter debontii]